MTQNKWWIALVVTAFASFLAFIHINSYWADKHKSNTLLLIVGIIAALAAAYSAYKVYLLSSNRPQ